VNHTLDLGGCIFDVLSGEARGADGAVVPLAITINELEHKFGDRNGLYIRADQSLRWFIGGVKVRLNTAGRFELYTADNTGISTLCCASSKDLFETLRTYLMRCSFEWKPPSDV
jgi:hypothetical protein